MKRQSTYLSASPAETERIAAEIAADVRPGDYIALFGEMGAGKTAFTRGLVAALAPECLPLVHSPTFAIVNEYRGGNVTVYHFDLYRLSGPDEFEAAGLDEWFGGAGVCLVEWPETVDLDARPCVRLTLRRAAEDGARDVELVTDGVPLNEAAFVPWRVEEA